MGKVDASKFGSSAPKLTPDDIEEAAILTISAYEEAEIDDDESESGKRNSAYLTFEETGEKRLWLNKGMIDALVEQLGDESDDWTGQKVPVEAAEVKFGKQKFHKVRVMDSDKWDAAFKEAGVRRTKKEAPKPAGRGRR